jgi:hypothetical protein
MKKIMLVAVATVFTVSAAIGATAMSVPAKNGAVVSPLSMVMPVSQELPFDRYWSKD